MKTHRILWVEDTPEEQRKYEDALRDFFGAGNLVMTTTKFGAIEQYRSYVAKGFKIDLALVDLQIPDIPRGVSRVEHGKALVDFFCSEGIPVLALTSMPNEPVNNLICYYRRSDIADANDLCKKIKSWIDMCELNVPNIG